MSFPLTSIHSKKAQDLLVHSGLLGQSDAERALSAHSCDQLYGDGSNRRFFRIQHRGQSVCILVLPAGEKEEDLAESRSAWHIGNHLLACNVPLPEIYGWDEENGILLFEDLGDSRLHDLVLAAKGRPQSEISVHSMYSQVVKELPKMQCCGALGFDENWCWDSSRYDQDLMLERESGYFLKAFWQGVLGQQIVVGVDEELKDIAERGSAAGTDCFLHRDFQCRNIMVLDGRVRFIDFQGGRLGPPGYDLASLLIDPYAGLSNGMQMALLDSYIENISKYMSIDRKMFVEHYNLLAFQRNMQIVGAFSFLSRIRGKVFFEDYIRPALSSLVQRLQEPQFVEYPIIRKIAQQAKELFFRTPGNS